MRVKSTGLGPTELITEPEHIEIKRLGRFLVLHMTSDEPVQWHLRTAFGISDVWRIVRITIANIFCGTLPYLFLRFIFKGTKEEVIDKY